MGARYIMTILIAATLCVVMTLITIQLWQKAVSFEVFSAVFTPFVLISREITDLYFKRDDRTKKPSLDAPDSTIIK